MNIKQNMNMNMKQNMNMNMKQIGIENSNKKMKK